MNRMDSPPKGYVFRPPFAYYPTPLAIAFGSRRLAAFKDGMRRRTTESAEQNRGNLLRGETLWL